MGTHKHHRYLTGARMAKADEFYTTYDAIDGELSHYRHDLAGRHVICDCNDRPKTGSMIRPDGTVGVNSVRWLTSLAAARADKTWTPTGHTYRGHEDEYPEYDAYDAINVDSMRMMPDDHDGPMGVPLNFLEHWAPGNGFMLLGKLDDPTVNGRRLHKRLLVRRTRDA